MTLGNRVREEREKRREGLREAAAAVGMDPGQLSRVETGQRRCSDEKKVALAEHFGMRIEELFFVPSVANKSTTEASLG